MIKVCHMTSAHDPEDVRIFYKECISLAKNGYEVYLVERGDTYEKNGVHIVGIGNVTGGRLKRMTQVARRVYQAALALDVEIYHFHDPELLPWGLKLKKQGKKVIFDSHENTLDQIQEKQWIPKLLRAFINRMFGFYQAYVAGKLDAVISVTPHICAYFKNIARRVCMITNFPICEDSYLQPTFGQRKLCFAGGVNSEHQFPEILVALDSVEDVTFDMCGDASLEFLENLKAYPGWKKVCYHGRVPHAQTKEIYAQASAGLAITPYSHNSGEKMGTLGNTKIYEIMMAGLPVICTDFDLWKKMIDDWKCGICVNPYSSEQIAAAIRYLRDHPDEAKQMGENGRLAVKEEFNWEREEEKLLKLYNEVLSHE